MLKNDESFLSPECMGSTVMGERGQVVIPKDVREKFNLKPGDKLLVVAPHDHAIALIPYEKAMKALSNLSEQIEIAKKL